MIDDKEKYIDGNEFHSGAQKMYTAPLSWAVNKKNSSMAKVVYNPPHENPDYDDERRGHGKDYATWIFSEENHIKENIFSTNLQFMIDAYFEPDASIGLHVHDNDEEIYYIIDGEVEMTTVSPEGLEERALLQKGDAHVVKLGQGHYGTAGKAGVRFICVAVKK